MTRTATMTEDQALVSEIGDALSAADRVGSTADVVTVRVPHHKAVRLVRREGASAIKVALTAADRIGSSDDFVLVELAHSDAIRLVAAADKAA
jgi:hypothetical protein